MKKLFTFFFFSLCLFSVKAQVVITEIMYNNPGTDEFEFIELYNNSSSSIQLENWTFSDAMDYTFPAHDLAAGGYVVIAIDAVKFLDSLGVIALDWPTGQNLTNSSENIVLNDATGTMIDNVTYGDGGDWPTAADGDGPSLVLCDFDADNNDPANWIACTTPSGFTLGTNPDEFFINPLAASDCPIGAILEIVGNAITVSETDGFATIEVKISSGNSNATSVDLNITGGTATNGMDYTFTDPTTVTFAAGVVSETQSVVITLTDDVDPETLETITFELSNPTNMGSIAPNQGDFLINIQDDDTQITNALVISGVFDAQPGAAGTKGFELKALADIADISVFGVSSVNNGGGSNGIEFAFPMMSMTAGQCLYVVDDSTKFIDFFGFNADFVEGAANINGDDAIELYENGVIIDVFGEVDVDGSGQPWEYLDGWVYRKNGTGPDGDAFNVNNWNYSGIDALQGFPNNDAADAPFPVCMYSAMAPTDISASNDNVVTDQDVAITINVLANDILPNDLTSMTIIAQAMNGTAVANGTTDITYTPNAGFCGDTDTFEYEICDANGCSIAIVAVGVACPISYTPTDIGDAVVGDNVQLQGIVYGIDMQGTSDAVQFTVIDATGGISLFSGNNFGYTVVEGDEIIVQGAIEEFSCLAQINPDTLWLVSQGNALVTPADVDDLSEATESELIRLNGWFAESVNGSNVTIIKGGLTSVMRIDSDTGIDPMDYLDNELVITGIGGQFDNNGPCDEGYQILPRYDSDIEIIVSTIDQTLGEKINFFPNPANDFLTIQSEIDLEEITISNMVGQTIKVFTNDFSQLDIAELPQGFYVLTFKTGDRIWATEFAKM
ncbi:MAG: hypothetical protein ACI9XO_000004 [Paraglaciecola sp.]|jgi:hypothetical protein